MATRGADIDTAIKAVIGMYYADSTKETVVKGFNKLNSDATLLKSRVYWNLGGATFFYGWQIFTISVSH